MTRRETSLLFGLWIGVLVLFLGHVPAQTTTMTTTTLLKKISSHRFFQDPRGNRTILRKIFIQDGVNDPTTVLMNVAESTTYSNREIYRDQVERSSFVESEESSDENDSRTWKKDNRNFYAGNDDMMVEKEEGDLNEWKVNRQIGEHSIPGSKITKLTPEEKSEEKFKTDEEGIGIGLSTTEENFEGTSKGATISSGIEDHEDRETDANFEDEEKFGDRTPSFEKILRFEDAGFKTTRSMFKDFLEGRSKDDRSSVTFSPEFEGTEEYGLFGKYTSPDFPEMTPPSTPLFDENHRRILDSIRKNVEVLDIENAEEYKPEESRYKFDPKAKDDSISLVNDTIVNYSNYYNILMDKNEKAGSRNLTTTLENGTNMIFVNTSVIHEEYSPKEEVEKLGEVTHPMTSKNNENVNVENKNVELDQESSALTSVFSNTKDQRVENASVSDKHERRSGILENDEKRDEEPDDFRNTTQDVEETHERNGSDDNANSGPKGRTIFFNDANDFPSTEPKTSVKSNDVNEKVFLKKSVITEKPIEQKPYPYTKTSSKELVVEPILRTEESEEKHKGVTEEASAYENTIGRRRSDEKVIITEPSVVIENSIQQFKPTYYKRSGNLTRVRSNDPNVSSTTTMPKNVDAEHEEEAIERSIPLVSNSSTGLDGSQIVNVENDVPRSNHEERDITGSSVEKVVDEPRDLLSDKTVESSSLKSTTETSKTVTGNFSTNNEIRTDAEESISTESELNIGESSTKYDASTKSDLEERNETVMARMTLTLPTTTGSLTMTSISEGVTDEDSSTVLEALKTDGNSSVTLGTSIGTTVESIDSSTSTTMTTIEYEFVGLTDTTISQNYIANTGENAFSNDDQETPSRTTMDDPLQGVTIKDDYTTETDDDPGVTLERVNLNSTTENDLTTTTIFDDAEETLDLFDGTENLRNETTKTNTNYTTTIPYEQFTEVSTTVGVDITIDTSKEDISRNETVSNTTNTTEASSAFNIQNTTNSLNISSITHPLDTLDTTNTSSNSSTTNTLSTMNSTTISSIVNIPITSSNVQSSSTEGLIVDSTTAIDTKRFSDIFNTTNPLNVPSTWSIWNTSTIAPVTQIVIKNTTEGPQVTLPADEITIMARIIFEGTWSDICPLLTILKESLAVLLTSRTEKNISAKQIIIYQTQCGESTSTSSSSKSSDVPLTSVLVYVIDENGSLDVATTEILPSLYKVSPISFPLTIHSFLTLQETDSGNAIAVVVVSSVAFICLVLLAGLLFIMRKRQTRFNYVERCRPVSLDAYSLDSVSAYNSVRRKEVARTSKRSYGNPTFEDSSVVPSHPLNFAGLSSFCNDSSAIAEEFSGIPQVTAKIDELPVGAEVKNRYANVVPLPETRVPLQRINNDPLTEYINASYVRGPKNATKYYIACQAPMESTVTDFWRMIWEQQSKIIIMLTDIVENGVEKCTEYIPPSEVTDCHRLYGDYQVTLKKRETKEKYAISTIHLKNLENNTFREISHIWYLWPTNGVPADAAGLIAVLLEARALQRGGPGPIVVHCSPGTGRTGTLIALDLGIRQYEITRTVDVPRVVYTIRRDRAGAVQTKEQYAFIYKALNLYAAKLAGGALESM